MSTIVITPNVVEQFCRGLSLRSRNRKYWRDGKEYLLLRQSNDAEFVEMHFGGEFADPNNLGRWSVVNGGHIRKDSFT